MVRFLRTNMPFGVKPICHVCKSNRSILWRKNEDGSVICNNCSLRTATIKKHKSKSSGCSFTFRKSTQVKRSKLKKQSKSSETVGKGKNRRSAVKKTNFRAPDPILVLSTNSSMFYKGSYFQVADVVSLVDETEGVFYAQIRGLMEDQYSEKYALIVWLIPTTQSPKEGFDLKTYLLGPEDENPYKLEYLQFVCHCNLDYFMAPNLTYPLWPPKPEFDIMLTSSGPQLIPHKEKEKSPPYLGPRMPGPEC